MRRQKEADCWQQSADGLDCPPQGLSWPTSIIPQDADDFKLKALGCFEAAGVRVVVSESSLPFGAGLASRGVARRGRDGQPALSSLSSCEDVRSVRGLPARARLRRLKRPGLVNGRISARGGVAVFLPGGVQCKRWSSGPECERRGGGVRGKIKGFSRASRRRLMDKLMGVDWRAVAVPTKHAHEGRAFFVTLTYPDSWPSDYGKSHLRAFRARLERAFGGVGAVWRLEFQERGAPHYHIMLVLDQVLPVAVLRSWVSRAWFEVVGSGDEKHLRAGTNVQVVYAERGPGKLMCYLGKYLSKESFDGVEAGRVWGIWGMLPVGAAIAAVVKSRRAWVEFCRRLRRWGGRGSW